jgi:hypothetical protein
MMTACGAIQDAVEAMKLVTCPPKTDPLVKLERWIEVRQEERQQVLHATGESPP